MTSAVQEWMSYQDVIIYCEILVSLRPCLLVFIDGRVFLPQVSAAFQKKVQNKIKDLLQQMEEGLKTADPHDFSTYTGWTGLSPGW